MFCLQIENLRHTFIVSAFESSYDLSDEEGDTWESENKLEVTPLSKHHIELLVREIRGFRNLVFARFYQGFIIQMFISLIFC